MAIQNSVRPMDTAARLGGDEFVIILPDSERQDIAKRAQKLIKDLKRAGSMNPWLVHEYFGSGPSSTNTWANNLSWMERSSFWSAREATLSSGWARSATMTLRLSKTTRRSLITVRSCSLDPGVSHLCQKL